jgi:hypothetical protein
MADTTDTPRHVHPDDTAPGTGRRMCVRCKTTTDRPVVVGSIERTSGPGWTVYACQTCAPRMTTGARG